MASHERILKTLAEESRWLTFDELYNKVRPNYNWIEFAELLEGLVEQGSVQYVLPHGADTGYYRWLREDAGKAKSDPIF